MADAATRRYRRNWPLTASEVAHAMPVLQSLHPALRLLPPPRLATIRRLAQRWDVRDGTLRTALSRACSGGSLESVDGRYSLGPLSVEAAQAARSLLSRRRGYVLVLIVEGEAHDLPALRELFARFGLRPFQRSAWVGARTDEDRLGPALERAGLAGSVVVFHCDEVDPFTRDRLTQLWQLEERAEELRAFHRSIFDYVRAAGGDRVETAWRCIEVTPVWYRVAILDEPPFPLDLLDSDYPLEQLRADWRTQLASLTDVLAELWEDETPSTGTDRGTSKKARP